MNILPLEKQIQIVNALVEGNSIRSTARMVGVEHKTVMRVLLRVGKKCQRLLDEKMHGLQCRVVEVDEIWGYVGKKQRHLSWGDDPLRLGDQYVFVAMDSETKLIPSYRIGKRNAENAWYFMQDLSTRLTGRFQLTTDGYGPYYRAVEDAFGISVDYAMLVKMYGEAEPDTRYSPGEIINARPIPVSGNPDPLLISTSHIERQNLTIRMQLRRFTRLTNAFSKKLENLKAALALHFAWYNFCRVHSTLRVTPAMAAGLSSQIWEINALVH